jgi:NitT/TauT family transport system permease protein
VTDEQRRPLVGRAVERLRRGFGRVAPALAVAAALVGAWQLAVVLSHTTIFPTPLEVARGGAELALRGVLFKYVVASLFRVSSGYLLAVTVGIPAGLLLGWFARALTAFNPLIQVLRPISPIAWIPVAILWFGVSDLAPIFLIFLASLFPITTATIAAVHNIQLVHLRAARNFGLRGPALFGKVVFPAALPQILTGLRLALGIAWLVVVAAEMIAVNSGLGYLIIDARNAGKRYDLVVAGMILIGTIGLVLDTLMRKLERLDAVRWGIGRD